MTPDPDLVSIGTFARAARLTVKALRHYQRERLLDPRFVDPATGYRFYSWDQLEVAVRIAGLRQLDVPVDAIRAHLDGRLSMAQLADSQRTRRLFEIAAASRALAALEELLHGPEPGPYAVDHVTHDELTTWSITRVLDGDRLDSEAAGLVAELLDDASRSGFDIGPEVWGEYPIELRGRVPVTVHLPIEPGNEREPSPASGRPAVLPAATYLRAVHRGSVVTLPFAYRALLAQLSRHDQPAIGPVFERYLTDPAIVPPDDNVIEVLHRVG